MERRKNDANLGLTRTEVIDTERKLLKQYYLRNSNTIFNDPKLTVIPEKVLSENQLVKANSMDYVRIPVTDGKLPTYEMVDFFCSICKFNTKRFMATFPL